MADDNIQSEMQSCCGQAVEECFCENNSFVRAEEVCGIVEPKLEEIKAELEERIKEFQECLIKEVCIVGKDGCTTNLAVSGASMSARDTANPSAGMKMTITSKQIPTDICKGDYVGMSSGPITIDPSQYAIGDEITLLDSSVVMSENGTPADTFCVTNEDCDPKCFTYDLRGNISFQFDNNIGINTVMQFSEDGGATWFTVENRAFGENNAGSDPDGGEHDHLETHLHMQVKNLASGETWCPMMRYVIVIENNETPPFEIVGLNYGGVYID